MFRSPLSTAGGPSLVRANASRMSTVAYAYVVAKAVTCRFLLTRDTRCWSLEDDYWSIDSVMSGHLPGARVFEWHVTPKLRNCTFQVLLSASHHHGRRKTKVVSDTQARIIVHRTPRRISTAASRGSPAKARKMGPTVATTTPTAPCQDKRWVCRRSRSNNSPGQLKRSGGRSAFVLVSSGFGSRVVWLLIQS